MGPTLYFPSLQLSDTGRYFCKIVVNNGCLVKYANYVLTGFCHGVLPVDITLKGEKQNEGNKLYWSNESPGIKECSLQRSSMGNNSAVFQTIYNTVINGSGAYSFLDKNPLSGYNYYRLKLTSNSGIIKYSNVVLIRNTKFDAGIYPNPVQNSLFVALKNNKPANYSVEIVNMVGQKLMYKVYTNVQNVIIEYSRNAAISSGIYTLIITDLQSNEKQTYKVVYK
jgi:hypothetical protein